MRILIVEDEIRLAGALQELLTKQKYVTDAVYDGVSGLDYALSDVYDAVILDIMLPKVNGYDVCKTLTPMMDVPIILLTAKTDIIDKVLGLELGADDYLTKPFDNRELLARIKAHLRRATKAPAAKKTDAVIKNGPLSIMPDERTVLLDGKEVHLTPKEFDLLYLLASNLEQVFPRDTLLEKIWGYDYYGDTRTVDMHVQRIRRKIDTQPNKFIQTVFGIGYKMRKI